MLEKLKSRAPMVCKGTDLFRGSAYVQPNRPDPRLHPNPGYLDDIIITPLGIALAVRLIPPEVLEEPRLTVITQASTDACVSSDGNHPHHLDFGYNLGATIILSLVEST